MKVRILCFLLFLSFLIGSFFPLKGATTNNTDSLRHNHTFNYVATGSLFLAGGLIGHFSDHDYSQHLNQPFRHHGSTLDDVGRLLPSAIRFGLKVLGVEGQSEWNRTIGTTIVSFGLTYGITHGLKNTINQRRPDWEDHKSTPSGHSAVAFMTAAMLDAEYGHISPLITLGGYAISTATSFNRTLKNHHYPSDVLMGAAIGLACTRASYWITDWILQGKGKKNISDNSFPIVRSERPSFIGLYGGYSLPLSKITNNLGQSLKLAAGLSAGLEGAWMFSPNLGIGGSITESHWNLKYNNQPINVFADCLSLSGGLYSDLPLINFISIGAKLTGGYSIQTDGRNEIRSLGTSSLEGVTASAGLSIGYLMRRNLDLRFHVDYNALFCNDSQNFLTPALTLSYSF